MIVLHSLGYDLNNGKLSMNFLSEIDSKPVAFSLFLEALVASEQIGYTNWLERTHLEERSGQFQYNFSRRTQLRNRKSSPEPSF